MAERLTPDKRGKANTVQRRPDSDEQRSAGDAERAAVHGGPITAAGISAIGAAAGNRAAAGIAQRGAAPYSVEEDKPFGPSGGVVKKPQPGTHDEDDD